MFRNFIHDAARLVVRHGGSCSGEHGDGRARSDLLPIMYSRELLGLFAGVKDHFDPDDRLNPGILVRPRPVDADLRRPQAHSVLATSGFTFAHDGGDFTKAVHRCVGVGKCRADNTAAGGFMCPSYLATRDEKDSTRGRARVLQELTNGTTINTWSATEVHESLDLCLSCKACASDCPAGVTQHRPVPRFAPMTLQQWFRERGGTTNPHGRPVVLFPDTFNNHLHTDVGVACVEAIEAAGWQVVMPEGHVCCGRPLYDYGFLTAAQRYLDGVLEVLRDHVRAGTPVVGMEPSCLAVFKDELVKMMPHDEDARRLSENAYHFAEFFEAFDIEPPRAEPGTRALLWGHCHHKATGGTGPEQHLLERMGVDVTEARGGCCGLAGSWGFESGKYDISMACGEEALLPAVRAAEDSTVVVADGFSCKTQISDAGTGRQALHVAQLMELARSGERGRRPAPPLSRRLGRSALALAVAGGLATGGAAFAARAVRRPD